MKLEERLSPHFTLGEFLRSQTAARAGIDNTPPAEILHALQRNAEHMEIVRQVLGDGPVYVSSGYRCLALNRAIGSKDTSAHVKGLACDFEAPGFGAPIEVCRRLVLATEIEFDQLIWEHTWTHIAWAPAGAQPRRSILTLMPGNTYAHGIVQR